jgi:hypothetical protein
MTTDCERPQLFVSRRMTYQHKMVMYGRCNLVQNVNFEFTKEIKDNVIIESQDTFFL